MRCIRQQAPCPAPANKSKLLTRGLPHRLGPRPPRDQVCAAEQLASPAARQRSIISLSGLREEIAEAHTPAHARSISSRRHGKKLSLTSCLSNPTGQSAPCERCRGSSSMHFLPGETIVCSAAAPFPSQGGETVKACCDLSSGAKGSSQVFSQVTTAPRIPAFEIMWRVVVPANTLGQKEPPIVASTRDEAGYRVRSLNPTGSRHAMKSRMAGRSPRLAQCGPASIRRARGLVKKPRMSVLPGDRSIDGDWTDQGIVDRIDRGCAIVASATHGDEVCAGEPQRVSRGLFCAGYRRCASIAPAPRRRLGSVTSPSPVRCRGGQASIPPVPGA